MQSIFDMDENIVGKGENTGYQHFLIFPHCVQKPFYLKDSLEKGKATLNKSSGNAFNLDKSRNCHFVNPFPNEPLFLHVCSTSLLKTLWEKEKLLVTSNFSFSHSVFHLFGELPTIFIKFEIVVCKLFQFGRV